MFLIFVQMEVVKKVKLFIITLLIFFLSDFYTVNAQPDRFVIIKSGFGLPFGAMGLNLEYRRKHVGGYAGLGYMKTQYYREINIPSSINGAIGLKYYFFKFEDSWHPIIGLHAGWLNNYYHKDIGRESYSSTVYGLALMGGVQLTENVVSLEMSMLVDPGFAILHPEKHPSYMGKPYFTPSIGVGVNLYAIHYYFKYKKRNKERQEERVNEVVVSNSSTLDKTMERNHDIILADKIKAECNDTMSFPAIKILLLNETGNYLAGKQMAENLFLFVEFPDQSINSENSIQLFKVDSANNYIRAYIIKTTKIGENLNEIAETILNKKSIDGKSFECIQGNISVYYYRNVKKEISIKLSDLKLIGKNIEGVAELYYDEILICLVAPKK